MKRTFFLVVLILGVVNIGRAQLIRRYNSATAPTGACQDNGLYVDQTLHNFYLCDGAVLRALTTTGGNVFTLGSVPFASTGGILSQDNSNLFWDNSNKRLGIGLSTPTVPLEVVGTIRSKSTAAVWIALVPGGNFPALQGLNTSGVMTTQWIVAPSIGAATFDYSGTLSSSTGFFKIRSKLGDDAGTEFLIDSDGRVELTEVISKYKNVAKSSTENGVPFTTVAVTATAQGADIGATNLVASATAGRYRLNSYITITRAATSSSTLPSVILTCTDPTDSVAKSIPSTATVTTNTTTTARGSSVICDAASATAIQYSTSGFASSGATSMQYKIYLTLEML